MKYRAANIALILGLGILGFLFLLVTLTAIGFLFHGTVSLIWLVLAFVLASGGVYYALVREKLQRPLLGVAGFIALIAVSIGTATATIDSTYDGNSYHKAAIGALKNGWNPVWQTVDSFNRSAENPFPLSGKEGMDRDYDGIWIDHYPKAAWIVAASTYKLTGNIESGKVTTPLLIIAVFLLAFSYLYRKLDRNKTIIVSLLLALTPITVSQLYSYYNDGIMGNILIILLLALTMLIDKKTKLPWQPPVLYGTIFVAIILAMNIKFTGLAYAGIIMVCYWIYLAVRRDWKTILQLTIVGVTAVAFGALVIGASSYVKNTYTNGNPLYPLMGKGKVDFITLSQPISYADKSVIHKFLEVNLGPTAQLSPEYSKLYGDPRVKVPFTFTLDELAVLTNADIRQGGYGVWFGGILLLSLGAGIYLLVRHGRRHRHSLVLFLLPLVSIGLSIFAFDATWWARYVPLLPLFPIIVLIALYLKKETVLAHLLLYAMLFNITLTGLVSLGSQTYFQQKVTENFAQHLKCDATHPPLVFSADHLDGALYNVWDACSHIRVLSPQEFEATSPDSRKELMKGVYVVSSTD